MDSLDTSAERHIVGLESSLAQLGADCTVLHAKRGPIVTTYYVEPSDSVRVSKFHALSDDIARVLRAKSCRVVTEPEKGVVRLEIARVDRDVVRLAELLKSEEYLLTDARLPIILGRDVAGEPVVEDLAAMPHLLTAGTTGSGKSVALNAMLLSILKSSQADKVQLLLIDPKRLEFMTYAALPNLLLPVITDTHDAIVALRMLVREMEHRYQKLGRAGVRNIEEYNDKPDIKPDMQLNYIVCVVDEFADLMSVAGKQVESSMQRLTQMARAAGIHVIVATQRPSVNIITGAIKANIPARLAFHVASRTDSRVILDRGGAESLIGYGDAILDGRGGEPIRVHAPYATDIEIENFLSEVSSHGYS